MSPDPAENSVPLLRVVRGEPTAEELAALVVAAASRATPPVEEPRAISRWADPARRLRTPVRPGPDAWRWAGQ